MDNLFQNKYLIQTARAEWHRYDGGIYFVTICTAGREHYFGEIKTETEPFMELSSIGQYANQLLMDITTKYPHVEIPLFIIMPNHIHAIVFIDGEAIWGMNAKDTKKGEDNGDAMNRVSTGGVTGWHNPMVTNCLGTVIRGLKARITRWANQNEISFGWQARFYDRIVRDQNELNNIAEYIENNVVNWQLDEMNIR